MKTLRDEVRESLAGRVVPCSTPSSWSEYQHGVRDALTGHGDWQIAEGVLRVGEGRRPDVVLSDDCIGGTKIRLGGDGDYVKLIIPPEELLTPVLDMAKKLGAERVRADGYERALREIVGVGTKPESTYAELFSAARDKARKALE